MAGPTSRSGRASGDDEEPGDVYLRPPRMRREGRAGGSVPASSTARVAGRWLLDRIAFAPATADVGRDAGTRPAGRDRPVAGPRTRCDTGPDDQPPAMDPHRRDHRIGRRLPRRHRRQHRPQADRAGAARDLHQHARGPGVCRQRLPGRPRSPADPRRRPVRPLRPPQGLRHRPRRVRGHLRAVRPRADARMAGHLPPDAGRRRRAARPGVAVAHHAGLLRAPSAVARSACGRRPPRP